MEYKGYEVLSDPLLMPSDTMPRKLNRPTDTLDPSLGAWLPKARTEYPLVTTEHKWIFRTAEQSWNFRRWLHRQAGRLSPIWIPSRTHDLVLASTPDLYGSQIEIVGVDYRNLGYKVQGMRHIALFSASGSFICTSVLEAYESWYDGNNEILMVDAYLDFTDIVMISFVNLHRFEADRISMVWERPGVGTCNASMVSIGFTPGAGAGDLEPPPA